MSFLQSFRFAQRGLRLCLRERNFRFHAALSLYMYGFLCVYDWFVLSRAEWAALLLATALVLAAEAFNTAIEAAVDLACPGKHRLAAIAKDTAAGAVLVCSLGAFAIGLVLLWQPAAFAAMYEYYRASPGIFALFALSLVGAAWFIWGLGGKKAR